ncbi:hypothetical protein AC249_AIPGENE20881 [Exaiptasia diaphana]|nr:hypothetical protein AC249_AIPGENE20881 [Exaiptasia diaphana]
MYNGNRHEIDMRWIWSYDFNIKGRPYMEVIRLTFTKKYTFHATSMLVDDFGVTDTSDGFPSGTVDINII